MGVASIVGVLAIVLIMAVGMNFHPIYLSTKTWMWIVGLYIAIASVTPVWILLQPRDYLSSFLLYAMLAVAVFAVVVAHPTFDASFPAVTGFAVDNGNGVQYLFLYCSQQLHVVLSPVSIHWFPQVQHLNSLIKKKMPSRSLTAECSLSVYLLY